MMKYLFFTINDKIETIFIAFSIGNNQNAADIIQSMKNAYTKLPFRSTQCNRFTSTIPTLEMLQSPN